MIDRLKLLEHDSRYCQFALNSDSEKNRILSSYLDYPDELINIWARYTEIDLFQTESLLTPNSIDPTLREYNFSKGIDLSKKIDRVYFHSGFGESYYDFQTKKICWLAKGHTPIYFNSFNEWLDFFMDEYIDNDFKESKK